MLQRTFFDPADERHGDWSREKLVNMDSRFCGALERAFEHGLESRAAARATVRAESRLVLPVSSRQQEEIIQAAWCWFQRNRDETDIPFAAVVARCPGVNPAQIRAGFDRRFGRRSPPPD